MGKLRLSVSRVRCTQLIMVLALAAFLGLAVASWSGPTAGSSSDSRFVLKPIPFAAERHAYLQAPRLRNSNGTSTNWSGYAVEGIPVQSPKPGKKGGTVTTQPTFQSVSGSWVVPDVVASTTATTYSSAWVGIDGYSSGTVEQIGTEHDWSSGADSYYAWFEMYPRGAYEIVNFPVNPGDVISAQVDFLGRGAFKLTIKNVTKNVTFTTNQKLQSASLTSAEWVMEAPSWGGVLPLADFGTINFSNCTATLTGGQAAPINNAAFTFDAITMQTSDGTAKAVPSDLSADGKGFSVTWYHE